MTDPGVCPPGLLTLDWCRNVIGTLHRHRHVVVMNFDSLSRLNRRVWNYDLTGREPAEGALGHRTSVGLNKTTLLLHFAAMDDAGMSNAVRISTELAQAFVPKTAKRRSRCMSCRAPFGYSWSPPEEQAIDYDLRLSSYDACAEVIVYLSCLEAHVRRKRYSTRKMSEKEAACSPGEG